MNYLYEYSTFETVKEMDEAISEHIRRNNYELNKTDRDVLLTLSRYACKYKGVSHLKVATIAEIVGKSSITVRRALNKLVSLNIIEKVSFMRSKSGGNGANIYVIMPSDDKAEKIDREEVEEATQASDAGANESIETINLLSDNNTLLDTENKPTNDDIIKRSLRNAIPTSIYNALEPFFNGQALYDTYGILLRAKAKIDASITLETYGERYIDAFYGAIRLYKSGKVRSLSGLLYTAWKRVSVEIVRKINFETDDNNTLKVFADIINKTNEGDKYIYE